MKRTVPPPHEVSRFLMRCCDATVELQDIMEREPTTPKGDVIEGVRMVRAMLDMIEHQYLRQRSRVFTDVPGGQA